jgi:hypothetical protein
MGRMKQIDIDRLAGEILRLDREVEGLATAGRLFIGQQVRMIGHIYEEIIKPQKLSGQIRGLRRATIPQPISTYMI